ncbi:MAG TPA: lipopolysaccharide heptosyltransferase II [Candidatus Krumholzibacteria bacterium]|nr:lipopolysaccharide heptosyltransferase II [Candidatus Krumholzibacteria bacterium]
MRNDARQRVTAVAPNWLGDAVMCLPALSLLARGASLSVLTSPYVARVFLHQPGVEDIHVDPAGGRARRIASRVRSLRSVAPRVATIFPPSFSSVLPAFLAGVPQRVGFHADGRGALLTRALPLPSREVHLVDSYVELARGALRDLGAENGPPLLPRLYVAESERASIRRRIAGITGGGYLVIVPGAAFGPAKTWPEERYRALCATLVRDTAVILTGSKGDRDVCERIAREVRGVHSLAGETSLGEMFALVEGALALVANDSGAPHVAAALDVPCVVLFGSTSPAWTAPRGDRIRVLQHKVHCNPCFRRTCPTQLECFNGIAVEDVGAAVSGILIGSKKAGAPGKSLG